MEKEKEGERRKEEERRGEKARGWKGGKNKKFSYFWRPDYFTTEKSEKNSSRFFVCVPVYKWLFYT